MHDVSVLHLHQENVPVEGLGLKPSVLNVFFVCVLRRFFSYSWKETGRAFTF